MICPKCKELGKKSTIYLGGSFSTCAGWQPYYDEDGLFHSHNTNINTDTYACSNGHRIIITRNTKCPNCDWGKDSEDIIIKDISSLSQNLNTQGMSGVLKLNND